MPKLTKRAICLVRTDGPILIIDKLCLEKSPHVVTPNRMC